MTISYVLGFKPKWYFANLTGKPLGAGYIVFSQSLQKTSPLAVYQDENGQFPWPLNEFNGVEIDANGEQGPFYFIEDTTNTDQTYFIQVFDVDNNLQWTMDNYLPPASGGGGGGGGTIAQSLNNLITNNVHFRNIGTSVTPLPVSLTVAPSNHAALQTPDIVFSKNNTSASDQIIFQQFTLGTNPLTGDVTPQYYPQYVCTNIGAAGETFKYFQYPVTAGVQNLSNTSVTVSVWAQGVSGTQTMTLSWLQFFGDGAGASASVSTQFNTIALTNGWVRYIATTTVPNVAGKVLGGCGNDTLYLLVGMPLNATCTINFVKPTVYIGNLLPSYQYETYDQIDSILNSPRTGDTRITANTFTPGWVACNDGTIGSAASAATTRANIDTYNLYSLIYNSCSQTLAPVTGGRGANAAADFIANKPIQLIRTLGRVIAGTSALGTISSTFTASSATNKLTLASTSGFYTAVPITVSNSGGSLPSPLVANTVYYAINLTSTTLELATSPENAIAGTFISLSTNGTGTNTIITPSDVLGSFIGERTHVLTIGEMPSHNHNISTQSGGGSGSPLINSGSAPFSRNITTDSTGGGAAHNNMQPTVFYNILLKL